MYTKEFASIAEAKAHYLKQGYVTSDDTKTSTFMVRFSPRSEVMIEKVGFLTVKAEEYIIA